MEGTTTTVTGSRSDHSDISTEIWLSQRVIEASTQTITMKTRIDSGSITVNGHTSPIPMIGQEVTSTMRSTGAIVTTTGFQGLDLKSMYLVYPDRPLGVGDSWTNNLPATHAVPTPLVATCRVSGFETHKGRPCVKIDTTVRSSGRPTLDGVSLDVMAGGCVYFDFGAGRIISNSVTSKTRMDLRRFENGIEKRITTTMETYMRLKYRF